MYKTKDARTNGIPSFVVIIITLYSQGIIIVTSVVIVIAIAIVTAVIAIATVTHCLFHR